MINTELANNSITAPIFNAILCPVDLGTDCLIALRVGRRLAQRNGAKISLVHVMTPPVPGGGILPKDKAKVREALEAKLQNELVGIDYQMIVRWGNPVKEIIAAERECEADLCVMTNLGRMGTSHFFMRSIAEKVARESLCPVLTVGVNGLIE